MFRIDQGKFCDKIWQYYTLEIGIYSSDVFALCWGKVPKGKSVKNTDCCLRGSISDFFQENGDIEFYEDVDVKELQERINFLIEKDIIPFFNKIKSYIE